MGTEGMKRVARLARDDRRLDRARRARPPARRARVPRRLRQDDPRRGDGARAARRARARALQRLDRAGPLPRPRRHDPGRLRGGRRRRRRNDDRTPTCTSSRASRARARARAAASSPRTRWRRCSSSSASAPAGLNDVPATDPAKTRRGVRGRPHRDAARARRRAPVADHHARRARERRRRGRRDAAARRTASCTCSRSRASSASRSTLDEFDRIAERTPVVADIKPGGRFVATDLHAAGGVALVARELLKAGLVHGDAPNVDGRSLAEVATAVVETPGQEVVVPIERPLKATGGLAILRGNLAPEGCVVKLAGHERLLPPRAGARVRLGGGVLRRGQGEARSRRATSSSSATRARRAARACARCCTSPPRSSAKGSATRSRSSPTAASPARRTA